MQNRRAWLRGLLAVGAVGLWPSAGSVLWSAQALAPVRLMLLRRSGASPTSQCQAPCVRGRLYDVSDMSDVKLDSALIPLLRNRKALCDVIERPWKNNASNVSAIPRGVYQATVRTDPSKKWMTTINRAWRLELAGTGHRTNIQFHYGEDVAWSEGCFIVGELLQMSDQVGISGRYCRVDEGESAVAALRAVVESPGRNTKDILVGVTDDTGLFPDFKPNTPC
jgi:hypothetical protein